MKTLTMAAIGITAVLLSVASSAQIIHQGNALVITSPSTGTVVNPGETITISVTVNSGTYPKGIAIIGGEAGGPGVMAGPLSGPSPSFSVTIPANADSGPFAISANGIDSSGKFDSSFQVTLDVERSGSLVSLRVDPPTIHFQNVGQSLPLTVIGVSANGSWQGLTHSSLLHITSNDTAIASVQNDSIKASGPGNTHILVSYGRLKVDVPVYVPQ
jgi:hypothetical protein